MSDQVKLLWKQKTLSQMNREEWESLCDHCGKCCLLKLQDDEAEDGQDSVFYTNIVCNLFDKNDGHCSDYWNRETRVPTCIRLTQDNLADLEWMPPNCSYRRIMEGRGLPKWHHLVTEDKNSIHEQGKSILGRVVFEQDVANENLEEHIVTWPLK